MSKTIKPGTELIITLRVRVQEVYTNEDNQPRISDGQNQYKVFSNWFQNGSMVIRERQIQKVIEIQDPEWARKKMTPEEEAFDLQYQREESDGAYQQALEEDRYWEQRRMREAQNAEGWQTYGERKRR